MSKSRRDVSLHRLTNSVNKLINYGFWTTTVVFGGLTISEAFKGSYEKIALVDSLIWKIILSSYFISWFAGVKFDKEHEEYVYNTAPRGGKLDIRSIGLASAVFLLFCIMFVVDRYSINSLTIGNITVSGRSVLLFLLNVLWFFNIPLWIYFLRKFIDPMSKATKAEYDRDENFLGIEKIQTVNNYIKGQWQKVRFIIGSILILVVDGFWIYTVYILKYSDNYASLIVCGYLVVIESWVWLMRARMKYGIEALDRLGQEYDLTPRTSSL
jgi:hypothetical protein